MRKNKLLVISLLLAAMLVLAGCQNSAPTNTTTSELTPPQDFFDGYEAADFQKYNSPASENGLGGKLVYIQGVLGDIQIIANAYSCIVTTNEGNQWAVLLNFSKEDYEKFVGHKVFICAIYKGYSGARNMPAIDMVKMFSTNTGEIREGFGKTELSLGIENFVNTTQETTSATTQETTAATTTQATTASPKPVTKEAVKRTVENLIPNKYKGKTSYTCDVLEKTDGKYLLRVQLDNGELSDKAVCKNVMIDICKKLYDTDAYDYLKEIEFVFVSNYKLAHYMELISPPYIKSKDMIEMSIGDVKLG